MGWWLFFQLTKEIIHMESKLFVGNLPFTTTEEDLIGLFAKAGEVTSVALIKDRDTGRSRGFAFVEMSSQVEAENAIRMFNEMHWNDRDLKVNLARPREERSGDRFDDRRSGGYGQRGGGGGFGYQRDNRRGRDKRGTKRY
jgi:RNA recognition motif-containing protein